MAGADESVLRDFVLDSELFVVASDFRFLPRLNRNNCLGLLAMSEIGDLVGMGGDGRETLLSGVPDYFYRNKISSGGDLSHYSRASLY